MPSTYANGQHQIVFAGDVFLARYVGDVSLAEFQQLAVLLRQHRESLGLRPQYTISDVTQLGHISAEGRRLMIGWFKENPVEVLLFHGAGLATRAVVRMLRSASRILYGQELPAVFVVDAAAAQEWIAKHRAGRSPG